MPDFVVQPTKKWIRVQYWTVFLVFCVCVGIYVNRLQDYPNAGWLLVIPALLFLFPIRGHLRQHFTKVTVSGDKLRYETGLLSKTVRTIQLSKVQDVRIDQTLGQRVVGVGNLSIETAGETSRLIVENVDNPSAVADVLIDAAHGKPEKPKGERG